MAFGLDDLAILSALMQGVGGAVGGAQQASAAGASTQEQARQFDIMRAERERKRREMLPLRDRLSYMFQQRLGMPQQQFKPHDIFNPSYGSGPAQMGGFDQNAWNEILAGYQPGMGGLMGTSGAPSGGDADLYNQFATQDRQAMQEQVAQRHTAPWLERMMQKAIARSALKDPSDAYRNYYDNG